MRGLVKEHLGVISYGYDLNGGCLLVQMATMYAPLSFTSITKVQRLHAG